MTQNSIPVLLNHGGVETVMFFDVNLLYLLLKIL